MILSAAAVSYGYGATTILKDVTFSVEDGDRVGVVGVNGSGKSTLFRILSGELTPDGGSVFRAKDKTVRILHQDDAFRIDPNCPDTVLEQMWATRSDLLELERRTEEVEKTLSEETDPDKVAKLTSELTALSTRYKDGGGLYFRSKCKSLLISLGFGEEYHPLPVESLSGGQRTRLALARLLAGEPDILLLDEPTNHLDVDTLEWLEGYLSSYKKTFLVVSHDRLFLDRVTNRTLDVENGTTHFYGVPYTAFVEEKEKAREAYRKKYDLQQKEIARLEAFIENQRRWNRERNIIAAESRMKAIDRMEKIEKPETAPRAISFSINQASRSGNDVLYVDGLTMAFPEKPLFRDLSFVLKNGDRLFVHGPNGCGKSTLLRILTGQLKPVSGTVQTGYNVKVGYYSQDNQGLTEENTVLDELWDAYPDLPQTKIRDTLAMFSFRGEDVEKRVSVLSGGERARLTLAKLILMKVNLLILDEPTNHLDADLREALERALSYFGGTLICVSHDRYFVRRLATRFIVMGDGVAKDLICTYDDLEARKKSASTAVETKEETVSEPSQKDEYLARKRALQDRRKAERRLEAIAEEAGKLEVEIADIDYELFGDAASDYVRAAELYDKKTIAEDRLMSLWNEEEALREQLGE
ncbi:MAG: ABC-F family ATP-binding cassette domain-containing protein [Clostridia bacterium]|nr:ABC-F family ATP-binding cassette domain-containing protein [Clostridia bacterium]